LLLIVIAANLVVLVALAFVYPHLMVSPGPLSREHSELATDCFACHAPWRGAAAPRCTECHALAEIGLRSTKGVALPQQGLKTSLHQQLIEQDCVACHSDHAEPKLTQRSRKPFSHDLLCVAMREVFRYSPGSCRWSRMTTRLSTGSLVPVVSDDLPAVFPRLVPMVSDHHPAVSDRMEATGRNEGGQ
jgi:hypothetical protein